MSNIPVLDESHLPGFPFKEESLTEQLAPAVVGESL